MIIIPLILLSVLFTILTIWTFGISVDHNGILCGLALGGCLISALIAIFAFAFAIIEIIGLVATHVPYCERRARIKVEEKRKAIIFCIENGGEGSIALFEDISEFNSSILEGRMNLQSFWFKDITFDYYNEIELIEVG